MLKVPNVGFLILEEPNRVLDKKHQAKIPGIIGWNLIWLAYKVFNENYGGEKFNSFQCLAGVNPLLFSQLCLYHYAEVSKGHNYRLWRTLNLPPGNHLTWLKKTKHLL